jgi:hypothetical protein
VIALSERSTREMARSGAIPPGQSDFEDLYAAQFHRLTLQINAYVGDLGEAQDLVQEAFTHIRPAGTQAAQATATHRKRVHALAMGVLVAVVIVAPVSAYAGLHHDHNGPPTVAATQSATPTVTPTSTPSVVPPSITPPSIPPSAPSTTPAVSVIAKQLENATLQIPSWGVFDSVCPHGNVRLSHGAYTGTLATTLPGPTNGLMTVVTADVNHDGNQDAVAMIGCQAFDPGIQQVVVFDRGSNGSFRTMGQVVRAVDTTVSDGITDIRDITVSADGAIRVQVANPDGSGGPGVVDQVIQWRTYGWTGSHFAQTAGSSSFVRSLSTLSVQVSNLVFQPSSGGSRTGEMIVTFHNSGSHALANASIVYAPDDSGVVQLATSTCSAPDGSGASTCPVSPIAPGATRTVTLRVTIKDGDVSTLTSEGSLTQSDLLVQIRVGDQKLTKQPTLGKAVYQ